MIGNDIAFGNVINMRSLKHEIFVVIQQLQLTILLSEKKLSIANHHISFLMNKVVDQLLQEQVMLQMSVLYHFLIIMRIQILLRRWQMYFEFVCKYIYVCIDVCSGLHVESITN